MNTLQNRHNLKQGNNDLNSTGWKIAFAKNWQLNSNELKIKIGMPTDCAAAKTEMQFIEQQIQIQDKA